MEFRFHQIDSLPRLAWCATFHRGEEVVEVVHGPWVETQDNFFCEGAWNGDFTQGSFQNAFMMGSGGRLAQGMVQLAYVVPVKFKRGNNAKAHKKASGRT